VITGFNTDIEYDGVTYHVQTEDKGLDSPIILSLVYSGGAILASKRAPYEDLLASGFTEAALAERLKRQHTLICAAIHAGRIDDLKRMLAQPAVRQKEEVEEPAETMAEAPAQSEPILPAESEPILAPPEILLPHFTQPAPPPPVADVDEIELKPPPQEYQPVGFKPKIQPAGQPPAPPQKAPEVKKAAEPKSSEPKKVPEPGRVSEPRTGSESTTVPIPGKPASEKTIPIPNRAGGAKAVPPPKVAEPKPVSPPAVAAEKTPAPPVTSAPRPTGDVYTVHDSRRKSPLGDLPGGEQRLVVSLLEDRDFRAGESLIVRLMVVESSKIGSRPLPNVSISLKILGTAFRPQIYTTKTGPDGIATVAADIPIFSTGRAAILIRASAHGQSTEIRRLVHPSR